MNARPLGSAPELMICMRCRAANVVRVVVLVGYKPRREELRCSACFGKPMASVVEHGLLRGDGKLKRPLPSNIVAKMVDALAARKDDNRGPLDGALKENA